MPPLREIREEIPLLAQHFLREYAREAGREPMEFAPAVLGRLTAAAWPGNIRQLRNEVQRMAACARRSVITEDEALELVLPPSRAEAPAPKAQPVATLHQAVEELERRMIREALDATRYNQQQAARALGLSRQGLINKMKRYALTA
jgi:DNA-binding NtrC family response regulator